MGTFRYGGPVFPAFCDMLAGNTDYLAGKPAISIPFPKYPGPPFSHFSLMAGSFRIRRGGGLVQLTDPLAFADAGRRYALVTAGAAPAIDLETSED